MFQVLSKHRGQSQEVTSVCGENGEAETVGPSATREPPVCLPTAADNDPQLPLLPADTGACFYLGEV